MLRQDVGESLFLVVRDEDGYYVEEKVVWGAKDTFTEFGSKAFMVLVDEGEEYEPKPINPIVFQHGAQLTKFFGAFEDETIAEGVCSYLNGF